MSKWECLEEGTKEVLEHARQICKRWGGHMNQMVQINTHPSGYWSDRGEVFGPECHSPTITLSAPVFAALMDELDARNAELAALRGVIMGDE